MPALDARGIELNWSERGEGAPVLLVHETAVSSVAWEPVADALAPGARAILYDRRGWGASTAPDGYARTTVEEQSEDAAVLIEAIGAGVAVVCGAGLGALIALDLLLRRSELVRGAVLIEPPILALVPEATELLSADRQTAEVAAAEGRGAVVDLYLSGGLAALAAGVERLPPELATPGRERAASLIAELGSPTAWGMPIREMDRAERRALIVTSPSTPAVLLAAADATAERLAGGERRQVDSGEAPPHIGAPAAVAELALELARA